MPRGFSLRDEALIQKRLWTPAALGPSVVTFWNDYSAPLETASGSSVSSVPDLSGNGRTATQATGANQPTYATNTVYGSKPGLTFPSIARIKMASETPAGDQAFFGYLQNDAAGNTRHVVSRENGGSGTGGWGLRFTSSQTILVTRVNQSDPYSGANTIPTGFNIMSVITRGSVLSATFRVNGVEETLAASADTFTAGVNTVGVTDDLFTYYTGTMAEILLTIPTISTPDIYRIEGYLGWKWDRRDLLGRGHPYVNKPPMIGG